MATYETNAVCTRVHVNVFREFPTRHPDRNKLEGGDGDAQEGDDVWVCQVFPHHGLLIEGLRVSLEASWERQ